VARAFVIRPFGVKKSIDKKTEIDFERVHKELIGEALKRTGLSGGTTGDIVEAGNIREDMFNLIIEADLVVCDITIDNANVFYELGIRHALRKKHSVLIKGAPVANTTPFDILTDRYISYDIAKPGASLNALTEAIQATLASDRETDSPIFKMLPGLPDVNLGAIQAVPPDFAEEIERAKVAKSAGWLRLLASDVTGLRFEWPGLRLTAQAQGDLTDYEGAVESWERIRANDSNDVAANLALATIYERLYRLEKRPELLHESNSAVSRVLNCKKATGNQLTEANALKARNLKTLWRLDFEQLGDLAKRREAATNRALREAYEAYRRAFIGDLNHYWSGLAALQQGTLALDLAKEEGWPDTFDNSSQAVADTLELKQQVEMLRPVVEQAVDAALGRPDTTEEGRAWARVSKADLKFLTQDSQRRVIDAYKDAMQKSPPFAWDAARGQLQLFAGLGFKADLVRSIIEAVSPPVSAPGPSDNQIKTADEQKLMIVFVGHRIDEANRVIPRFPGSKESKARELVRQKLADAASGRKRVEVLASAAPGSDILCHEICREMGIPSTICLPMPLGEFSRHVFGDADDEWRSRFLELSKSRKVLQLSDKEGLPRWLHGSVQNPWERGNRWVLEMARTSNASVVVIALWDGKPTGDNAGGTAHMVKIARGAGTIVVRVIDSAQLLT
jgi:hypothetical protein